MLSLFLARLTVSFKSHGGKARVVVVAVTYTPNLQSGGEGGCVTDGSRKLVVLEDDKDMGSSFAPTLPRLQTAGVVVLVS